MVEELAAGLVAPGHLKSNPLDAIAAQGGRLQVTGVEDGRAGVLDQIRAVALQNLVGFDEGGVGGRVIDELAPVKRSVMRAF